MSTLPDQVHRDRALDTSRSYIVQAPAGSGKTELLSLRYLRLLSLCDHPEEVLAITFTRKAASEMRDRIVESLASAAQPDQLADCADPLLLQRYSTAAAALARSEELGWQLLDNPARLRIQTIDSFCRSLAARTPLLSRLGGNPQVSEEVEHCFADAIASMLAALNGSTGISDDIALLLRRLDNDIGRVEGLLSRLLYNRDQWLPHVIDIHAGTHLDRDYLVGSLNEVITESLAEAWAGLRPLASPLTELVNHAALHLETGELGRPGSFEPLTCLPPPEADALETWQFLANLLLTGKGDWRRRVDKRQGFPASVNGDQEQTALCKARRGEFHDLLNQLVTRESLREALAYVLVLPGADLDDSHWDFLTALARVLARLSAELLLAFQRNRIVDHAQIAAAALSALGSDNEPTDLALAMDYRIRHLLVDEFQDTSRLQTDLLVRLTAGWEPADGRTLFLVGDAMQSVYGFRNANVGIYLKVREQGLGDVSVEPLTLNCNFRSQAGVVQWVNQTFASAFPDQANPSRGAVPYSPAAARKPDDDSGGISLEWITAAPEQRTIVAGYEARQIARRILSLKSSEPDASIAILVRNRTQLRSLIPALREAGVHWQATDIDRLESLPVIEDLQSLTRALWNHGDRIAWLALLRAPWCGLSLADVHAVASAASGNSLWSVLQSPDTIPALGRDGHQRLQGFVRIMDYGIRMRHRAGLARSVEAVWTLLRGGALTRNEIEQISVARYLDMLRDHTPAGDLREYGEFAEKIAAAFVPSSLQAETDHGIHILTMHKAKGLEFDHVILPGLATTTRSDDHPLLQWHERINQSGEARLLIAALPPAGQEPDPLYRMISYERQRKERFEAVRLLYIAVTRARKSAHLSATMIRDRQNAFRPASDSLLSCIWQSLEQNGEVEACHQPLEKLMESPVEQPLSSGSEVQSPASPPAVTPVLRFETPPILSEEELRLIDTARTSESAESEPGQKDQQAGDSDEPAATVGTLIHRALETLTNTPEVFDNPGAMGNLEKYWSMQLQPVLPDAEACRECINFIKSSVFNCRKDPDCSWIFDSTLHNSATEIALTRRQGDALQQYVIDRTFVDKDNVRWVIDYKTAQPAQGESIGQFIKNQLAIHGSQLENYRRLYQTLDTRPVITALLLTAIPRLIVLP